MIDIDGPDVTEAETRLVRSVEMVPDETILYRRAGVKQDALDSFLEHHMGTLKAKYPQLDPRLEAPIVTMMRHCFLVGAVSRHLVGQRE